MLRILFALTAAVALAQAAAAATWEIPAGVKTVTINDYPPAFAERGSGQPVVLVHGLGVDYSIGIACSSCRPPAFV